MMHKVELLLVGGHVLFGEIETDMSLAALSKYALGLLGGSFDMHLPDGQVAYIATEQVSAILSRE